MFPLKDKRILSFETWRSGAFHGELLALKQVAVGQVFIIDIAPICFPRHSSILFSSY